MKLWEMIGWLPKWLNRELLGNQSSRFTLLDVNVLKIRSRG